MLLVEALAHCSMTPVTVKGPAILGDEVGKQYRWYGGKIQSRTNKKSNWRDIATIKVNVLCNGIIEDSELFE